MSRELTEPERRLMTKMLSGSSRGQEILGQLSSVRVVEMSDGGMGSLRFVKANSKDRRLGETVSQAEFMDDDDVTVSVTINLDDDGCLYELDVWKVDFSPLMRWPKAEEIVIKA